MGSATEAGSVFNPAHYTLVGDTVGELAIRSVQYDPLFRAALLQFDQMLADQYTLTVSDVRSVYGMSLAADYQTTFLGISDISAFVDITFGRAHLHRSEGTISYEVGIRNKSDLPLILPVLLSLDPAAGYTGLPQGGEGRTDDGKWLIGSVDCCRQTGVWNQVKPHPGRRCRS